jgi:1-aminocyclopropane-1-carboxylate deaminase/D-cysteine desulfhydrase-like pyridoxal-dependent ACC family enzyme
MMSLPAVSLVADRSPVQRLSRFETALGATSPRIFVKRDDLLPFGLGGNKVRKLQLIAAAAAKAGADTLITCGAVQSNHARVTAAVGAVLGWRVILVLSGSEPAEVTGNLRLDRIFGADVRFVPTRAAREPAMERAAAEVKAEGRRPFVLPLGGSTPLGAAGMARGVAELGAVALTPDIIFHASSSAGTQAGLIAGCALLGLRTRVIGVSADESRAALIARVETLLDGMAALLGGRIETVRGPIEADDGHVGDGYGLPTPASIEATELLARTEGIVVDQVYSAKALAALVARVRAGEFTPDQTVLFWQTGGFQ